MRILVLLLKMVVREALLLLYQVNTSTSALYKDMRLHSPQDLQHTFTDVHSEYFQKYISEVPFPWRIRRDWLPNHG